MKFVRTIKEIPFLQKIVWAMVIVIPFIIYAQDVIAGEIPFWYDSARDFLSAQENLSNITLIGPTSGIPGVFYGPYWIWLLSTNVLISKDPRVATVIIGTIPYLILFPMVLLCFRKLFGFIPLLFVWLLFVMSFGEIYSRNLWNPHVAPLLILVLITILFFTNFKKLDKITILKTGIAGVVMGLILNFHISLGIGLSLGSILWIFCYSFKAAEKKKSFLNSFIFTGIFIVGLVITFAPFFLFEVRHDFIQTLTIVKTLTASGAVVGVTGLSKNEIVKEFFQRVRELFDIPLFVFAMIMGISTLYLVIQTIRKKISWTKQEIKLLSLILTLAGSILVIYLLSKNPVWGYHFIGVEVLSLFLIAFLLLKIRVLQVFFGLWLIVLIMMFIHTSYKSFVNDPLKSPSFVTKKYTVEKVYQDAGKSQFEVFAYSPSIYTYDYAYLFTNYGSKTVSYKPEDVPQGAKIVYLIIPPLNEKSSFINVTDSTIKDFINFRTPDIKYKTTRTIQIPDGTTILKREIVQK